MGQMRSDPSSAQMRSTRGAVLRKVKSASSIILGGETCNNDEVTGVKDELLKKKLDQGVANEVTGVKDELVVSLQDKLNHGAPLSSSKACIFRVPSALRGVNEEAYTPQVISIGPYHHGTKKPEPMEEHKLRYLSDFFGRKPINSLESFVGVLRELEEDARQCYGQTIEENSNTFVEMMLLDGCFIIELFLKFWEQNPEVVTTDPIFHIASVITAIRVDMLLVENQLPFFILQHLFILATRAEEKFMGLSFVELTLQFFNFKYLLNIAEGFTQISNTSEIKHFLDLLRYRSLPENARVPRKSIEDHKFIPNATEFNETGVEFKKSTTKCILDLDFTLQIPALPEDAGVPHKSIEDHKFIPSATELHEAGVKFKKSTRKCILDLDFTKGTLQIPELKIQDSTEPLFRNLIAFEQCSKGRSEQYITNYLALMDFLINSPGDVAILRRAGIINNWLGDNEQVSLLFNKIFVGVTMFVDTFYFHQLAEDVNVYYKSPWHSF